MGCSGPRPASDEAEGEERGRVYHVQLYMSDEKEEAAQALGRAERWWTNQPSSERPPLVQEAGTTGAPIAIKWKAPFYRVRVGPFATRKEAEAVLGAAQSTFPDAFVAPDRPESQ